MEQQDNIIAFTPARGIWHFTYPHQLAADTSMSIEERRAILSAWASDIHAVESLPVLRHLPGTPFPVTYTSIMDALAALDREMGGDDDPPPPRAMPVNGDRRWAA